MCILLGKFERIVPGIVLRLSKGSNDAVVRGLRDKVLCVACQFTHGDRL